jgi:large subunit ribosomal protein L16
MDGVTEDIAKEAMRLAAYKLPVKTKFIVKAQAGEKDES